MLHAKVIDWNNQEPKHTWDKWSPYSVPFLGKWAAFDF